jgi:hypothetical protein
MITVRSIAYRPHRFAIMGGFSPLPSHAHVEFTTDRRTHVASLGPEAVTLLRRGYDFDDFR